MTLQFDINTNDGSISCKTIFSDNDVDNTCGREGKLLVLEYLSKDLFPDSRLYNQIKNYILKEFKKLDSEGYSNYKNYNHILRSKDNKVIFRRDLVVYGGYNGLLLYPSMLEEIEALNYEGTLAACNGDTFTIEESSFIFGKDMLNV